VDWGKAFDEPSATSKIEEQSTGDESLGVLFQVQAEYDYDARDVDELSFHVGDVIDVYVDDDGSGWAQGELNGTQGLFCINFTAHLDENGTPIVVVEQDAIVEERPQNIEERTIESDLIEESNITSDENAFGEELVREQIQPQEEEDDEETKRHWAEQEKKLSLPLPRNSICRVRALYSFDPEDPDEISIGRGDVINLLRDEDGSGWMIGEVDGRMGTFPSGYVEYLK